MILASLGVATFTTCSRRALPYSLKDHEHDRHVLGEAEIIECIGDNRYLAPCPHPAARYPAWGL